jgi:hypothetical protein
MARRTIAVTQVDVDHLGQGDGQDLTIRLRSWDPALNPRAIMGAHSLVVEPERVLKPCRHCGQWGAIKCPCAHCGAPIGD